MRTTLHRRKSQRGNALVEFALAFGFLFPLLTGTFQFGYAFFVYNELQNAVRQGARYAAFKSYYSDSATPTSAYANEVKNAVVYGNPGGTGNTVVPGLTTSNVNLVVEFGDGAPTKVTVSITGYSLNAFLRTFTLSKPTSTFNFVGHYGPPTI